METQDLTLIVHEGWLDYLITVTDFLIFFVLTYKLMTNQTLSSSMWYNMSYGIVAMGSLWKGVISVLRFSEIPLPAYWETGWVLQPFGIFLLVSTTIGVREGSEVNWKLPWKRDSRND